MFASPIFLQASAAAAGPGAGANLLSTFLPIPLIFVAAYFLLLRPQQKQAKMLRDSLNAIKKGDEVVTAGGHIGRITKVDDREVEVEFAQGQRHRVVKATIAEVRPLGGGKPAND
jgi:preprotein translocase subunit YajC